ncbi:protein APCDD1-like isoform X1 [Paramormyrops kingsleyae]|uniref:APC down-regulated 1 like n=1 Tax=Paramormyrops kingsleyae TaxID=1676925 RepID=A0A3B3RJ59_9TELE|nr:protein APCDD1-like isoform X1 [Paramormyrops kingsleyae]
MRILVHLIMLRNSLTHLLGALWVLWLLEAAVLVSGSKLWEVPTAPFTVAANSTAKLLWEPQCQAQLRHLQDGGSIRAVIPPTLDGNWVSTRCEVRPGPEFLTRLYTFYPSRLFKALQFYYRDSRCQDPAYSLVIRGKLRLRQASWITRGGTEAEHHLHRVAIMFHSSAAVQQVSARLPAVCRCSGSGCWVPGRLYDLFSPKAGRDCLGPLGFSMLELDLLRLESRQQIHSKLVQELFLGDIHTEWEHRTRYRPTGYQMPLQNAMNHVHPCPVCALVYRSSELHPPVLPSSPTLPLSLDGRWVSQGCEVRPAVLFLTRDFTFHEDLRGWEGFYRHYSDPTCRQPTFSVRAWGHYARVGPSPVIHGATEFVFKVTRATVVAQDEAVARVFNASQEGSCGQAGGWAVGVEQDITPTHGCTALGIKLPHKEYELFKIEFDHKQRPLLFTGERPTDGSSPDRPHKRPTSYQAPLIQCSLDVSGSHRHDQQRSFTFQPVSGVTSLTWLLASVLASLFGGWCVVETQ